MLRSRIGEDDDGVLLGPPDKHQRYKEHAYPDPEHKIIMAWVSLKETLGRKTFPN